MHGWTRLVAVMVVGAVTIFASLPSLGAARVQVLGSRAGVGREGPLYGAFVVAEATTVFILVRGNSLLTLGVTTHYLDAPRVRLFDGQGVDIVSDGRWGFGDCLPENASQSPVYNYYRDVRAAPVDPRDACLAISLPAGTYTFTVLPSFAPVTALHNLSSPSYGEVLFEVTFNP